MQKLLLAIAGSLLFNFTFADAMSDKIVVAGSSALLPLTLTAKKNLKEKNPQLEIDASGQGSATGLEALQNGSANIAAVDWDASKNFGDIKATSGLIPFKVALTPFATVVNPGVKVKSLTGTQLQGIFSGKIKNWKEVGGDDLAIVVINRTYGSGTRFNYQAKALNNGQFMKDSDNYKEVKSSGEMLTNVATTPGAIGYLDLAYVKDGKVKALEYNGVAATEANIKNGKYPVWGYGYYMTKGEPSKTVKDFITYVQSAKFQKDTLPAVGFMPINSLKK